MECEIKNLNRRRFLAALGVAAAGVALSARGTAARAAARSTRPNFVFILADDVTHRSPMLATRGGKWKLLMNPDRSRTELYDIVSDPTELDNVADENPEVVRELSERLLKWQKTLPAGPSDDAAGSNAYPWPKSR